MPRRWLFLVAVVALSACGGGDDSSSAGQSTPTTVFPIEGVETFRVEAAHTEAPVSYPHVPPYANQGPEINAPC